MFSPLQKYAYVNDVNPCGSNEKLWRVFEFPVKLAVKTASGYAGATSSDNTVVVEPVTNLYPYAMLYALKSPSCTRKVPEASNTLMYVLVITSRAPEPEALMFRVPRNVA
jgi:hypothetical protein